MVKYEIKVEDFNYEGIQEYKYGESNFQCDENYGSFYSEQFLPLDGKKIELSTEAEGTVVGIIVRAELV